MSLDVIFCWFMRILTGSPDFIFVVNGNDTSIMVSWKSGNDVIVFHPLRSAAGEV